MLDGYIVVYKFIQDLHFFVTGGDDENELIIATVLQGFFDAVGLLLRFLRFHLLLFSHVKEQRNAIVFHFYLLIHSCNCVAWLQEQCRQKIST